MKTIYRNGQKFIITDALYEATKNTLSQEEQPEPQLFNLQSNATSDDDNFPKTQNKKKITKLNKVHGVLQSIVKEIQQNIPIIIKKCAENIDTLSVVDKKKVEEVTNTLSKSIVRTIQRHENNIIIKYARVIQNTPVYKNKEKFEENIFKNVSSYATNIIKMILDITKLSDDSYKRDTANASADKRISAQDVYKLLNAVYQEIKKFKVDLNTNEQLRDSIAHLLKNTESSTDETHEIDIRLYYNNESKETPIKLDWVQIENEFKNILNTSEDLIYPSLKKTYKNISSFKDSLKIVVSEVSSENTKDICNIMSGVVKNLSALFTQEEILIELEIDGVKRDKISLTNFDEKSLENVNKYVPMKLPQMLMDKKYAVNEIIVGLFDKYLSVFQQKGKRVKEEDYNETVQYVQQQLDIIHNKVNGVEIKNPNWWKFIVAKCCDNKIHYKRDNITNVNIIDKIFKQSKNTNNIDLSISSDKEIKNDNNLKVLNKKSKNKNSVELYKYLIAKDVLQEIETNDYYKLDEISEIMFNNQKTLKTSVDLLKGVFATESNKLKSIDVDTYTKDIWGLYIEYVYVSLILQVISAKITDKWEIMGQSERQFFKKHMGGVLRKQEKTEIQNNDNLIQFIQQMGRKPKVSIDKPHYEEMFNLIQMYKREMIKAQELIIDGAAEFGIFRWEIDVRPIKQNKFDKVLKLDALKKGVMKDAFAYISLTKFYKDYENEIKNLLATSNVKKQTSNKNKIKEAKENQFKERNTVEKRILKTIGKIVPSDENEQITFDLISESILKEMLIFTDVNIKDVYAVFSENDKFLTQFSTGSERRGIEGEGDTVYTIPIISKKLDKRVVGLFRVRKIFSKTKNVLGNVFKHKLFSKMGQAMKRRKK